jgi:asparagine synthase (glutamine-hydrolysing)
MTRESVVVAINGDGGDEALGGYTRYNTFLSANAPGWTSHASRPATFARWALSPLAQRSPTVARARRIASVMAEVSPARRYGRLMSYFDPESKERVLTADVRRRTRSADSYGLLEAVWDDHANTDAINRVLAMDTYTYLPGDLLPKVDITTMSASLEARSPLLDHTFMEWTAKLPGHYKIRDGETKYLFKKALQPWLSGDLIYRRKQGFGVPLEAWLNGPLRPMIEDILPSGLGVQEGLLDPTEVRAIMNQQFAGANQSPRLYALLMFELWMQGQQCRPAQVPAA